MHPSQTQKICPWVTFSPEFFAEAPCGGWRWRKDKQEKMARTSVDGELRTSPCCRVGSPAEEVMGGALTQPTWIPGMDFCCIPDTWGVHGGIPLAPCQFPSRDLAGYVLCYLTQSRLNCSAADLQDHKKLCWQRCSPVRNLDIFGFGSSFAGILAYP